MSFRYSPQYVIRYKLVGGHEWEEVARYDDATVRDQSGNNFLGGGVKEAMLRAYSSDLSFYGNDTENYIWTEEMEAETKYKENWEIGVAYDVDGDLALKRIMMNAVLGVSNYGHGDLEYIGFVARSDNEEQPTWDGWGNQNDMRMEKWRIYVRREE